MILSSSDRYEILTTAVTLNWRLSTIVLSKIDHYGNNKQKNLKTISFKEQVGHRLVEVRHLMNETIKCFVALAARCHFSRDSRTDGPQLCRFQYQSK